MEHSPEVVTLTRGTPCIVLGGGGWRRVEPFSSLLVTLTWGPK